MDGIDLNRVAKDDVTKMFESPYDSKSLKVSYDVLRLSSGKDSASIGSSVGTFTWFS